VEPQAPATKEGGLRLITWNVARRIARLDEQAQALAERQPDVLCLQEVSARSLPLWQEAGRRLGLRHQRSSLQDADPERAPRGPRRTGVLVASRDPIEDPVGGPAAPWAESVSAVTLRGVQLLVAHVPNAANGAIKPQTLHAIAQWAHATADHPIVICGDLTTPRRELPSGEVWTFARDSRGRLRPERGEEWDRAERSVLREIPGLVDVFRALHGHERRELSWTWARYPRSGYRLDHVVASPELRPTSAVYHHEWRETGLSDHSALEVDFESWRD
jgi:exonuclease III